MKQRLLLGLIPCPRIRLSVFMSAVLFVVFATIIASARGQPTNSGKASLVTIDENNWRQIMEDEWMIEFYAPWFVYYGF